MANTRRNFLRKTALGAAMATVATTGPVVAGLPTIPANLDAFDPKAIFGRVEFAIDVLRDRYICKGWNENFDHAAATRVLNYFKQVAEHGEFDDEAMQVEWEAALDFFHSHGVSLDWIIVGDIASLISKGAAHSMRAQELQTAA